MSSSFILRLHCSKLLSQERGLILAQPELKDIHILGMSPCGLMRSDGSYESTVWNEGLHVHICLIGCLMSEGLILVPLLPGILSHFFPSQSVILSRSRPQTGISQWPTVYSSCPTQQRRPPRVSAQNRNPSKTNIEPILLPPMSPCHPPEDLILHPQA